MCLADFQPKVPENYKIAVCLEHPCTKQCLDQWKQTKISVLDTMNFWMDCIAKLKCKAVDVITINDEEARQLSENILWLKRRPKSKLWGKYVVIKGEHGALLFHDLQVFFAPALPLEEVLIQQERRYFAGGFAGFITQSENVSFENMKMLLSMVLI
jgi:hypothetical protein